MSTTCSPTGANATAKQTRMPSTWTAQDGYGHLAHYSPEEHRPEGEGTAWRWKLRNAPQPIVFVPEDDPRGTPATKVEPAPGPGADLGMSTRAIAPIVGASDFTVRQDIAGARNLAGETEPRQITGRDGKTYTAPSPSRAAQGEGGDHLEAEA